MSREENRRLIEKYPFLKPNNYYYEIDNTVEDDPYEFTWLDDMPDGWRKAFGEQMCEDMKNVLAKADFVDKYQITQLKEKYASLHLYDNGVPTSIYDEFQDVLQHYEDISRTTCVMCGKPAEYLSTGWICPFCEDCADKLTTMNRMDFTRIRKYYED